MVTAAYRRGQIDLAHYRGRSCYAMVVQAAEHFARRELALAGVDDVRPVNIREQVEQATVTFETPSGSVDVTLERLWTEPRHLTCHAPGPLSAPEYRLVAVEA
jgi:hypothetical protein